MHFNTSRVLCMQMHSIKTQINFTYDRRKKSSPISNDGVSMNASHTASYRVTLRILFENIRSHTQREKSPFFPSDGAADLCVSYKESRRKTDIGKFSSSYWQWTFPIPNARTQLLYDKGSKTPEKGKVVDMCVCLCEKMKISQLRVTQYLME